MTQIHSEQFAHDRLRVLGLSRDDLTEVCLRGYAHWADHTELDPPSIPNTNLWGRATRAFREVMGAHGWGWDNADQQPRTFSPDGRLAVVVSTGDAATGLVHLVPSTKNPKGDATARKVAFNQAQLDFPDLPADESSSTSAISWMLLIFVDDNEVRAELSLPAVLSASGFVTTWAERIILPPIDRAGPGTGRAIADDGEDDGSVEFDVPVEPR